MNQVQDPVSEKTSEGAELGGGAPRVAVIGAGVAGLEAARVLAENRVPVELFEKARGPGGRLATRRMNNSVGAEARFDFGAQFFSAFSLEFSERITELKASHDIIEWFVKNGTPRHAVPAGMNALAKNWARDRKIHLQARVAQILRSQAGIELHVECGPEKVLQTHGPYRSVILTAPVPQALELLEQSSVALIGEGKSETRPWSGLANVQYHPCLAVMLLVPQSELGDLGRRIDAQGYQDFENTDEPWSWIASNSRKGLPCPAGWAALTVHLGSAFSRSHLERSGTPEFESELLALFRGRGLIASSSSHVAMQVHRWRYSLPESLHNEACFKTDIGLPGGSIASLFLAGDGFQKARVEGAFLSGNAAARLILEDLRSTR